jgi:plasmid stabilization system protein ParE
MSQPQRLVVIADTAKEDLEFIASYLQNQFSNKAKIDFLVKLSEKILLIESMPFMYPASIKNPRVRRCIIHKNISCFYEVSDTHIFILSLNDNRINPDSIRF